MKYNKTNKPLVCMQANSSCYRATKKMTVRGILIHSTGANNKTLKRYVQPSKDDKNYDKLIKIIGVNINKNDYNHASLSSGLNAFIGSSADGTVLSVQTMPWNYRPWGCGSGSKGSCNDGWIQFEICEDSLLDDKYFDDIYCECVQLVAYLCSEYSLNPLGYSSLKGVKIPVITCHSEANRLGFASNHRDIEHWLQIYNKTMDNLRNDVNSVLSGSSVTDNSQKTVIKPILAIPTLRYGNIGNNVEYLQNDLNFVMNSGLKCDGIFGIKTKSALRDFQSKYNIQVDGIYGNESYAKMKDALSI